MKKFAMNKDQLMGGGASASPWGGGGYGGSSAVGPSTSWKPPSEEESLEQLQKRIDDHDSAIKDSLHRTTAMANQTREVGAATLRDIHMQGEQLKGIAANQQKVEENLQTSNKLLRGMESWRGTFVNWAAAGRRSRRGGEESLGARRRPTRRPRGPTRRSGRPWRTATRAGRTRARRLSGRRSRQWRSSRLQEAAAGGGSRCTEAAAPRR
mmetsp:Transcript_27632/g.89922  ORF Transcript_27632/g.89922 Transcript_27632/m.89922 type:complete len:210 (+) Transcript_27632:66-695(+)